MWQPADGLNKNTTHMSFPLKLDMGCYTGDQRSEARYVVWCWEHRYVMFTLYRSVQLYSLQSVIEHTGGPSSGHYTTYRKVHFGKSSHQWVHLSDTDVYNADIKEVLKVTAFMLFYERIVQD